jgi:hypothetical protein
MAKYARIFMTGFRTAPMEPEVLKELSNKKISFKSVPLNTIKIYNITLFSDYDVYGKYDPNNIILSGVDTMYDSFYSGDLYPKITGIAEFVDEGPTNSSGIYVAQGYHTGFFSGGQIFYDQKNRQVYPINENLEIVSSDGATTGYVNSPITYRDNRYTGVYTGSILLKDNFYDPDTSIVTFYKNFNYTVSGDTTTGENSKSFWFTGFNVVSATNIQNNVNNINEPPGIFILNKVMSEGSGFASSTQNVIVSGNIIGAELSRRNLIGYSQLTGRLTGQVLEINSGIYIFNQIVTGNVLSANQGFGTGFTNSFNFLNLNDPEEFDFINITNPNLDVLSTFTFSTGPLFRPPLYFDSLNTLNNIINSGTTSYGITSEIAGGKLKIVSATSGESGNLISVESFGSPTRPFFDAPDFLQSGITYYAPLTPTGIFSGNVYSIVLATGLMTTGYSNFVTGNLTGVLGLKKFEDVWRLYVSDNNISYIIANAFPEYTSTTGIKYISNFIDDPIINLYNIQVEYSNPNNRIFDDIAELKISLNDAENINIRFTGVA